MTCLSYVSIICLCINYLLALQKSVVRLRDPNNNLLSYSTIPSILPLRPLLFFVADEDAAAH
jgi:hypothetical protein